MPEERRRLLHINLLVSFFTYCKYKYLSNSIAQTHLEGISRSASPDRIDFMEPEYSVRGVY